MSNITSKRLLLVKFSNDVLSEEIDAVRCIATLNDFSVEIVDLCKGHQLRENAPVATQFDFLYLCGHGNVNRACDDQANCMSWQQFAEGLCAAGCIKEGALLFCACCRGGLDNVCKAFFDSCPNVHYVCGPRSDTTAAHLLAGFHTVLHSAFTRDSDFEVAARIASDLTGRNFVIHDHQTFADRLLTAAQVLIVEHQDRAAEGT